MGNKFKVYKFLEVSEIIFTLCIINFAVCYYCWYGKQKLDLIITIASMLLAFGCFIYIIANIALKIILRADSDSILTRRYLGFLKNRKEPYSHYGCSISIRTSYVWRKFVFGINPYGVVCELLCITTSVLLGCGIYFSVRDRWQYLNIVLPLLTILSFVAVYGVYHFSCTVFRSGNGLMRHAVINGRSIAEISKDFRDAERISRNLRISNSTIFFRNYHAVTIINVGKIKDYKMHKMSVAVRLHNSIITERMDFNTKDDFNAVCLHLMQLYH